MNKSDIVLAIAKRTGGTKADAERGLNAALEVITNALKKGDSVQLVGFGTFQVRKRAARNGVNPSTGEKIKIKAKKAVIFKSGAGLKDAVN
ncbi:MAG: HU family DNA-binding protein [bacterium]